MAHGRNAVASQECGDYVLTKLVFRPDPKDVPEVLRRSDLVLGQPFVALPDEIRPAEHKVLAVIQDHKIRRADVEMVFNDTISMDFVYRHTGCQSDDFDSPGSFMSELRAFSRKFYGEYGKWAAANYGVNCLLCDQALPDHLEFCTAGLKHDEELNKRRPRK